MKLTNPKTFEKWCEKNNFYAGAMLDGAERWASECDGTFGHADIDYETGRTTTYGSPETIRFDLVRAGKVLHAYPCGTWAEAQKLAEEWNNANRY